MVKHSAGHGKQQQRQSPSLRADDAHERLEGSSQRGLVTRAQSASVGTWEIVASLHSYANDVEQGMLEQHGMHLVQPA